MSASINQTFICNATDWQLKNITLKVWDSNGPYYNETKNITGISNQTSFNLTNMSLGNYHWNCEVIDAENNLGTTSINHTLTIGTIEVTSNYPANNSYTNINYSKFNCTSTTDSNLNLNNITFHLWNSTGYLLKNESKNISGINNITTFNYTFENNDKYIWKCTATNNISQKASSNNFTINYDDIYPTIFSLIKTSTSSSITMAWYGNESTNFSITGELTAENSSFSINHSIILSGLDPATTYNYNLTYCDQVNNCNMTSSNFTTLANTIIPRSSGGGRSSTPTIYNIDDNRLMLGETKGLKEKEKMTFSLDSGYHKLEALRIEKNSAYIVINSEPIYLTLLVGEEIKLNMSSSIYYDLLIKLNSINYAKANITIQKIFEKIIIEENKTTRIENETKKEIPLKIFEEPKQTLVGKIITEFKGNKEISFILLGFALIVFISIAFELSKSKKLTKKEIHHNIGKHRKARHNFTSVQRVKIKDIKYSKNKSKRLKTSKTSKHNGKQNKKTKTKTVSKR